MSTETPWWEQEFEHLKVGRREQGERWSAVVTLALPEQRNAMSEPMTASWVRLMDLLGRDTRLASVVLTGEGTAFCAGGNLSWIASEPGAQVADLRARMLTFYRSWLSVRRLEVPVVAAVNGHAVGAGLALALACDIRYVATGAKLTVPFTSLGIAPGMGTSWSLPRVGGQALATDMLLTGRVVRGDEAVGLGIASASGDPAEVLDLALAASDRIAAQAPIAVRLTLAALREPRAETLEEALVREALAQATTLATADMLEGLRAAQERRAPEFTGR